MKRRKDLLTCDKMKLQYKDIKYDNKSFNMFIIGFIQGELWNVQIVLVQIPKLRKKYHLMPRQNVLIATYISLIGRCLNLHMTGSFDELCYQSKECEHDTTRYKPVNRSPLG